MAIPAAAVWEVQTGGNDTNGGGFVAGGTGTDFSLNAAKNTAGSNISTTDAVATGTTNITSATAAFTSAVVDNIIYLQGGSGAIAAGWYRVVSLTNATTIVIDRAVAASTGMTMNIGGAFASPGNMGLNAVAGNSGWIKAGTYTLTNSTANTAGGPFNFALGGSSPTSPSKWEGYQTTRGDMGTPPVISAGARTSITIFSVNSLNYNVIGNITVDGNSGSTNTGFVLDAPRSLAFKIGAQNCTVLGISAGASNADGNLYRCWATGCSGTAAIQCTGNVSRSEAYANTTIGFNINPGGAGNPYIISGNISSANTGGSSTGFTFGGRNVNGYGNVSYGNGSHGFSLNNSAGFMENNISEANTGNGYTAAGSTNREIYMFNNAYYNNTAGNVDAGLVNNSGGVLGTGSFFVSAGTGNFALNNTAGAGAAARATGYPGLLPRGTTTGYTDIGAAQHQDSGGGTAPTVASTFS